MIWTWPNQAIKHLTRLQFLSCTCNPTLSELTGETTPPIEFLSD
jgi:hypothetical protein